MQLRLERQQRMAWDLMEEQAKAIDHVVRDAMVREARTGIELHRDFFLAAHSARCSEVAPDLTESTVEWLILQFRDAHAARERKGASHRKKGQFSCEFLVPKDEVVFSTVEDVVRIPYLGLVRFRPNSFITVRYRRLPKVGSKKKVDRLSAMRRTLLHRKHGEYTMIIDCSKEGGKKEKGAPGVRKWLR